MPQCSVNEPALLEILPGHLAACYAILDVGGAGGKSHTSSRYEYGDVKPPM
jgi:hypothetical protein